MSTPKRPRTPAQQEASRQNGTRSRGPVTDTGKQRSSRNALKHGLCADSVLLPGEDETECQELIEQYEQHYRPVTSLELARVREMALCDWRLRRVTEIESGLLSLAQIDAEEARDKDYRDLDAGTSLAHAWRYSLAGSPSLPLLLRYQAQLQRTQERARKALKQLQAEREQQEREQAAMTPNEPKHVTPIRPEPLTHSTPPPTPAVTPNEPKPTSTPATHKSPNEPKPTPVQNQQDSKRPPQ